MMKLSERIRKRWNGLRFNQDYHLGLGDIRLTIGMQDELLDEVTQLEAALTVIRDVSYDRDGHTGDSVKLGELVDEIYKYAVDALKEGE